MIFDLDSFTAVERMRGDSLYLVQEATLTEANSDYGTEASVTLDKIKIPGYVINNRNSTGVALAGKKQRYDAAYYSYLNVHAGFDPSLITDRSYLMANEEGLYELKYIESVRHFGKVYYQVYELEETDNSKKLFQKYKRILLG